jgi:hypothetical protein
MPEHRPEVADVFRQFGSHFLDGSGNGSSARQRRALRDIAICRTAALGGHKRKCTGPDCDYEEISYNSCRNRHCPKCQGAARAKWYADQAASLLPVEYFHVVFTLLDKLCPLVLQNQRTIYSALFTAASEALLTIARDPKHLGAEIGFHMILHTWGQKLLLHPHVHCVVPGGGLSADRSRWISCRNGFFLPVRVLSRLFRTRFLAILRRLYANRELTLAGRLEHLKDPAEWQRFLLSIQETEWVVYSKPPFGGPEQVLKYLARYTHRVAISNHRVLELRNDSVIFSWKDYARGGRRRTMALPALEFIRRFLLHVLPSGFVRIRHYGFLANRNRRTSIPLIRRLLHADYPDEPATTESSSNSTEDRDATHAPKDQTICPKCKTSRLILVAILRPDPSPYHGFLSSNAHDTS